MVHRSRSEQRRLQVQTRKDPKGKAMPTKRHRDATVYVRPTAADTQEYIDALNEGETGVKSDEMG